ncbi:MAG: pyridoxal-phosphate dependent enzyme [Sphaerobacteraceae bacterium]|nr:MAG: pyridoxal-phosphate dependent enzyme [Sphaerobacteraceae bacterium]
MTTTLPLTRDQLLEPVHRLPRERFAHLPTPLEEAPRLREALGPQAPRIFIKREDQTGLAFGGNKVRHLEFRLADIWQRGATALTIMNPAVSNHARLHAALAAKFGLSAHILKVPSDQDAIVNGNLLLARMLGAEVIEPSSADPEVLHAEYRALKERLEGEGHVVYDTAEDPYSTIAGAFGFLIGAVEMLEQCERLGIKPDRIFLVYGASAAGLVLAGKLLGETYRVHAVNIGDHHDPYDYVLDFANRTSELLGYGIEVTRDDFDASAEYGAPGYAVPGDATMEAISLAARTEALIVDPVYTGKSLAALIGEMRKGKIGPDENVVFIHTGGTPNPFSYSEHLLP